MSNSRPPSTKSGSSRDGGYSQWLQAIRADTVGPDPKVELAGCLPWRSPPSDRVSEIREARQCQLDRLHPSEIRLLATPEMAQTEGRDLANQGTLLMCKL